MKAINNGCPHDIDLCQIKICSICDPVLECFHCGRTIEHTKGDYPKKWELVEFFDGWFPMCPNCKKLFPDEIRQVKHGGLKSETIVCMARGYKRTKWYKALKIEEVKSHGRS